MVVQTLVMVVVFWIGRSREGRKDTQKINPELELLFFKETSSNFLVTLLAISRKF